MTDAATPAGASGSGAATYVFGIARTGAPWPPDPALPRLPGAGPVRTLDHAGLSVLVCDVDPDLVASASGADRRSLDRVATVAMTHDRVLASMAAGAPVVPLRLGTVLTDDDTVTRLVERNAATIHAELDRFQDHAEWAVTVQLPVGDEEQTAPSSTDGTSNPRRRDEERRARRVGTEGRARVAAEVHARLAAHAAETDVVRPVRSAGAPAPPHHGVYLVATDRIRAFQEEVEGLRAIHRDAVIEMSGPWPPYHFTAVRLTVEGTRGSA